MGRFAEVLMGESHGLTWVVPGFSLSEGYFGQGVPFVPISQTKSMSHKMERAGRSRKALASTTSGRWQGTHKVVSMWHMLPRQTTLQVGLPGAQMAFTGQSYLRAPTPQKAMGPLSLLSSMGWGGLHLLVYLLPKSFFRVKPLSFPLCLFVMRPFAASVRDGR